MGGIHPLPYNLHTRWGLKTKFCQNYKFSLASRYKNSPTTGSWGFGDPFSVLGTTNNVSMISSIVDTRWWQDQPAFCRVKPQTSWRRNIQDQGNPRPQSLYKKVWLLSLLEPFTHPYKSSRASIFLTNHMPWTIVHVIYSKIFLTFLIRIKNLQVRFWWRYLKCWVVNSWWENFKS